MYYNILGKYAGEYWRICKSRGRYSVSVRWPVKAIGDCWELQPKPQKKMRWKPKKSFLIRVDSVIQQSGIQWVTESVSYSIILLSPHTLVPYFSFWVLFDSRANNDVFKPSYSECKQVVRLRLEFYSGCCWGLCMCVCVGGGWGGQGLLVRGGATCPG